MSNPIIQTLNKRNPTNELTNFLKSIKDPNQAVQILSQKNPQFAEFYRINKDKSPEQIANDYGVDLSILNNFLK